VYILALALNPMRARQGVEDDYMLVLSTLAASISLCHSFEITPFPVTNFGHVFAVLVDVLLMLDELVHELVLEIDALVPRCGVRGR
jgi:hypothetical protein